MQVLMALLRIQGLGIVHSSMIGAKPKPPDKPWGDTIRNSFMQHVMIDLETLGTVPGCVVLSIGAVAFNPRNGEMDEGFYQPIIHETQEEIGLHICPRTAKFWAEQSEEARAVFTDPNRAPIDIALMRLNEYLGQFDNVKVWGNGADFDNAILSAAYRATGVEPGWPPFNGRCYRTIKNLVPDFKMTKRQGTHHNALDDARSQAQHLLDIVQRTTLTLA